MKKILYILFIFIFCNIFELNSEEIPYLLTASAKGDLETVKAIIQSGGDPNTEDKDKINALMYASRKNQVAIVEYLISQGAKVNKVENDGWTALMFAAIPKLLKSFLTIMQIQK
jgi:ankyrin repeat protein